MKIHSKRINPFNLLRVMKKMSSKKSLSITQLIVFSLFSMSCSNTDVGIHYYSLNTIDVQPQKALTIKQNKENTFVVIDKIALSDFLNTGSLVMQVDSHQIQLSNQHRWGDKLPSAIATHLMSTLSSSENHLYVENKTSKNEDLADQQLTLYFDQFTITNNHETIISGYYRIQSKIYGDSKKSFFDIRQPLSQDGYNHAVETFKKSLSELSNQIVKAINK